MANLETTYLGLKMSNPVIVGSSGLTNSVEKIKILRDAGAGAVVLKSLFEEQITHEVNRAMQLNQNVDYPEAFDYIREYSKVNSVSAYLKLIEEAKAAVDIPVIASINCFSSSEWIDFAVQIQNAGADAIELNLFVLNTDKNSNPSEYEETYYKIAKMVSRIVTIPVSMKIGNYFSNLVSVVNKLSVSGAKGVVLFNRFYEPDINIHNLTLTSADVFSTSSDIRNALRWVAIVTDKVKNIEVSASTGVHDGEAVIKQLLAGAKTVQVCSAVYKGGPATVTSMIKKIETWMNDKGFKSIDDFRGKMNYGQIKNPMVYERAQFMKYFSSFE